MATLTGAQGIATGRYHASHMSNNENWEAALSVAGRGSGDLTFPAVGVNFEDYFGVARIGEEFGVT